MKRIALLNESSFDQLLTALTKAPAFQTVRELSAWVATETSSIPQEELKSILVALASTFRVQRKSRLASAVFAVDLWETLTVYASDSLTDIDLVTFKKRLGSLLKQNSLDILDMKASELQREVDKSFCRVRILTDLRPIFIENPEENP